MFPRDVCGPNTIKKIRKTVVQDAEKGLWQIVPPVVLEPPAAQALDIDKIIAARHPIESRGINQYIEFMFFHGGLHALRSDPFNRIFKHINEADVRAIVGFEITAFER